MAKFQADEDLIRQLAKLLEDTGLTEIEISEGNRAVRVSRAALAAAGARTLPAAQSPTAAGQPDAASPDAEHPGAVASPMVGTAYLSPQPGAAAFVKAGDRVVEGQTLMIIEAMKVMNPIPAPRGGTVTRILVKDAQPVEFGEALLILE